MPLKHLHSIILMMLSPITSGQVHQISGKVTANGVAAYYATVVVQGSTLGTICDEKGKFILGPIAADTCTLVVSLLGYETKYHALVLNNEHTWVDVKLEKDATELKELVVTGVSRATLVRENPAALVLVRKEQITQAAENNVIDAVAKNAPGLTTVKTGPNISKPFIDGSGYNRVLTLYDGMRVETQQWGDEHGVPMDDYLIERAEVIKGPASLMYGSDAIAGVLSLFVRKTHDTDRKVHGTALTEYQTNNGLLGTSVRVGSASPRWAWSLGGSHRMARSYTNSVDGRVYNTGFETYTSAGHLGYTAKKMQMNLNFSTYSNQQGVPDGSRDSVTRKFTWQQFESGVGASTAHDDIKNRPLVDAGALNSYGLSRLSQQIIDTRVYADNAFKVGDGDIYVFVGGEQNVRKEYNHPTDPGRAGENITLTTIDYSLRYNLPSFRNIEPCLGASGMYQLNKNEQATDFPIPDYALADLGVYTYEKWKKNKWTIAGGLRYDRRVEKGNEMFTRVDPVNGFNQQVAANDTVGAAKQFSAFSLKFQGITGSLGATYRINKELSAKVNIARGYRAPNITEISANGLDPGAHIYYLGNRGFSPEFSLQEDLGIAWSSKNYSWQLNAFRNQIDHYIFEDQATDNNGNALVVVPGNRTFQFKQTEALLYGMDASLSIHPESLSVWEANTVFSTVRGINRAPEYRNAGVQGEYLPFIPPAALATEVVYTLHLKGTKLHTIKLKGSVDRHCVQRHYLGLFSTETATSAYTVANLSVHTSVAFAKKQSLQIHLQVNNLFDAAYQSHLSRLKYFEYYKQSSTGKYGIYDMGRNICIKVIFEF